MTRYGHGTLGDGCPHLVDKGGERFADLEQIGLPGDRCLVAGVPGGMDRVRGELIEGDAVARFEHDAPVRVSILRDESLLEFPLTLPSEDETKPAAPSEASIEE